MKIDGEQFLDTYINRKLGIRSLNKYSFWFPVLPSPTLARIVADITSDGHLSKNKGIIQFISKHRKETEKFNNRVYEVFKVRGRIRNSPSNKRMWEVLILNQPLCRILKLCGTYAGNKVLGEFGVPNWILNGPKIIQSSYLEGLFDGEGSVHMQKRGRIIIKLGFYKEEHITENSKNFLVSIQRMLNGFSIKSYGVYYSGTTFRKDGKTTLGYEIQIHGTGKSPYPVINFAKHVNFSSDEKRFKLAEYVRILGSRAIRAPVDYSGTAQFG